MARNVGSAAVAHRAAPQSAVAQVVSRCADRLGLAASLALSAATGPEPWCGAEYLLDTLDDLRADLHRLRTELRSRRT
jgi:hypothetical protein